MPYPLAGPDDLRETVRGIEDLDRRVLARPADVRDSDWLQAAVRAGISEFGRIDVLCANAGILSMNATWEMPDQQWQDVIDTNLTGVWRTVKAVVPAMIEQDTGGSIVLTSSTAGIRGFGGMAHYTAAKHGVVGLMKVLANELAQHMIRVNSVHPTAVNTDMIHNEAGRDVLLEGPARHQHDHAAARQHRERRRAVRAGRAAQPPQPGPGAESLSGGAGRRAGGGGADAD